jgi:flagellar hook assembly protein FlgD
MTTIECHIPVSGEYELSIYNILGQRVCALFSGEIRAGRYLFEWDGMDGSGNPVASGVYFYQLNGKEVKYSRKMLLLK